MKGIDGGHEGLDELGQIGRGGSAMGKETEAKEEEGEDGGTMAGTEVAAGGGAGVDEDRWKSNTRL